ncbi:hypothetical protein SEVIR_5G294300v4 [Setaria viridis]|uniref:DUF4408 domain-containing protein n=1 Tax=Setaria viridis TaxID=4556 RepID=A0A4U6UJF3_SETVI|nr:pathogen-associated molecular patterns-induced protein A70-like [Setaria viridis]TKW16350.1 hypothetical protein SEVIR_5G294300v2 [Setaria viridis]
MDGADAFAAPANPWSLVRGYFSPATLFLLLNMVIGTIALTSRSRRRHHHHLDDRYQQHYGGDQHQHAPPPLVRTSSVMERLRSLGLYRFRSGDFPPEYNHHLSAGADDGTSGHEGSGGAREAQAQYARSRSETAARPPPVRKATNKKEEEAVVSRAARTKPSAEVMKLERAPAQAQVRRAPRAPATRAQLVVREEEEAAAAVSVDARADDFINKFRQQLQLQRLNSLLNYKEMLNRGL